MCFLFSFSDPFSCNNDTVVDLKFARVSHVNKNILRNTVPDTRVLVPWYNVFVVCTYLCSMYVQEVPGGTTIGGN
jgi:hypothetical protein